jgi:low affinity Fe/Cu permease
MNFDKIAQRVSDQAGRSWAFFVALGIILVWGVVGPLAGFSDTWQLVINTGTTIITFLMVFIIQNTQNRQMLEIMGELRAMVSALGVEAEARRQQDILDPEVTDG